MSQAPLPPPVSFSIGQRIAEATTLRDAAGALAREACDLLQARAAVVVSSRAERSAGTSGVVRSAILEAAAGLDHAPRSGARIGPTDAASAARAIFAQAGLLRVLVAPVGWPGTEAAVLAVARDEPGELVLDSDLGDLAAFVGPLLRNVARYEEAGRLGEPRGAQAAQSERLRALGELATGVAHDLNNLLHAIGLRARLLAQKLGTDPLATEAARLEGLTSSGSAAVRRLLDFARHRVPRMPERLEPAAILGDVATLVEPKWRRLAELGGLRFDVPVRIEAESHALGDPGEIREALINLALNALDAMPAGGTLTLRTRDAPGGMVSFEVEDTGAGMPPDVLARAGQPFFTTKAARRQRPRARRGA